MPRNSLWKSKRNSPGLQSQPGTRVWVRLVRPIVISLNQTRFQLLVPVLQFGTRDAEPPCSNARKSPKGRAFLLLCADFIVICELGKYCITIGKCFQQQLYLDKKSFSGRGQWQVIHDWAIWPVLAFDLQSYVHSHFSPPRKAILHGGAIYAGLGALTPHTEETGSCCAAPDWHHTRGWSKCPASVSWVAGFPRMHH